MLASLRAVTTRLVVFDTAVVDLTDELHDPVDVLFGTQLGGGTDINRAVTYCRQRITRPAQTIFVLISDLYEGGVAESLLRQTAELIASGVTMVCLLALSDQGSPCYDEKLAVTDDRAGRAELRVHARSLSQPDGGSDQEGRHRGMGGEE